MRKYPILWKRSGVWSLVLWDEATESIIDPTSSVTVARPMAAEIRTMSCVLRADTEAHSMEAVAIAAKRKIPAVNLTIRVAA